MVFDTWYIIIIRNVPEGIALIALCLSLINQRESMGNIIKGGLMLSAISIPFFLLPFEYGAHVPYHIIVISLVLRYWFRLNLHTALACTLITYLIIMLIELFTGFITYLVLDIPQEKLQTAPEKQRFLLSLPPLVVYYLIFALIRWNNFDGRVFLRFLWKRFLRG